MIKLTQAGSMNRGPAGNVQSVVYLAPESIESIAANPNYGKTEYAACTVIRTKTGAIHYVDESAEFVRGGIK